MSWPICAARSGLLARREARLTDRPAARGRGRRSARCTIGLTSVAWHLRRRIDVRDEADRRQGVATGRRRNRGHHVAVVVEDTSARPRRLSSAASMPQQHQLPGRARARSSSPRPRACRSRRSGESDREPTSVCACLKRRSVCRTAVMNVSSGSLFPSRRAVARARSNSVRAVCRRGCCAEAALLVWRPARERMRGEEALDRMVHVGRGSSVDGGTSSIRERILDRGRQLASPRPPVAARRRRRRDCRDRTGRRQPPIVQRRDGFPFPGVVRIEAHEHARAQQRRQHAGCVQAVDLAVEREGRGGVDDHQVEVLQQKPGGSGA